MCREPEYIPRLVAENHADPRFGVERLARLAGMSTVYLREVTRRVFRSRPHDMIEKFRLQQAARLLLETEWPVDEIALRAGFHSPKTFRRAFRKIFGCKPSEMRRNIDHRAR
jgi:AraC-like DNA-binding protein